MILIINICKEPLHYHEFVRPIEDILRKEKISFNTKHYLSVESKDVSNANKIIVCGTSLKDNDFLKYVNKFKFLLTFKKPVLGICGGSHVIGLLLKYKLKKQEEIGLKEITLDSLLGVKGKRKVYHLHQFYVLPETFHKDNLYATLFHPEVRNKDMIINFARL